MGSPQAAGEPPSPGAAQAAVLPPLPAPLFEHFVVCGLAGHGLQTVQGEPGFLGVEVKYKPAFLDRLPHGDDPKRQPPPQLPTVRKARGRRILAHGRARMTHARLRAPAAACAAAASVCPRRWS